MEMVYSNLMIPFPTGKRILEASPFTAPKVAGHRWPLRPQARCWSPAVLKVHQSRRQWPTPGELTQQGPNSLETCAPLEKDSLNVVEILKYWKTLREMDGSGKLENVYHLWSAKRSTLEDWTWQHSGSALCGNGYRYHIWVKHSTHFNQLVRTEDLIWKQRHASKIITKTPREA